jgi:hypothetical protein
MVYLVTPLSECGDGVLCAFDPACFVCWSVKTKKNRMILVDDAIMMSS